MALFQRRRRAPLSTEQAAAQVRYLKSVRDGERAKLDVVRRYWKGVQRLPAVIPSTSPREVREMARIARVNVCEIVVDSLSQSLFVDNYRSADTHEDAAIWKTWQANKMDSRQAGIHRAAFAYGAAYAVVTPGDPQPVIRGVSPRALTAVYGNDLDWPTMALELRDGIWRLYDEGAVYLFSEEKNGTSEPELVSLGVQLHGAGVTPVVRYLDAEDLDRDDDVEPEVAAYADGYERPMLQGQVSPLMPVQDQIDLTTFSLLVAQWYTAFRQRYAIGWVPDDEAQKMKAAASQLWTFDESPSDMQLGEFSQTNLNGYIESRKESIRHAATLSQTPVHELIGELVNLSAEALAAAEAGHERKVGERQMTLGEAHEQTLRLAGALGGIDVPVDSEVVWRDTSARSVAALVDALGKMSTLLDVPAQELWERIPGVTKQDVERWKKEAAANPVNVQEVPPKVRTVQAPPPAGAPPAQ